MKNKCTILSGLLFSLLLIGTGWQALAQDASANFNKYKDDFINSLWKHNPEWATYVGYHKYDDKLTVPDDESRKVLSDFAMQYLDQLKQFDISRLAPQDQIDYHLIRNQLEYTLWGINEKKDYEWDPSQYNVCGLFAFMLSENYAPLKEKLEHFYMRAKSIPIYYEAAKKNITNPVPELQQLAIDQNQGGLTTFTQDFMDSLKVAAIPDEQKKEMVSTINAAVTAINKYVDWLKGLHPEHPRSFRLGEKLYEQKFKYEIQSEYSANQLYDFAVERKKYIHEQMAKLSKELWPKYCGNEPMPSDDLVLVRKMIDTISIHHTTPDKFQATIEAEIPKLIKFINDKGLLYLDPSKPLVVRREPAYMAGVAGASISAPGPYDKNGNTYYNVGSLEGWPAEKAESYLREYNDYMLQILSVHEAIPGHYTQLVYANKSPSIIKSVLGNGSMIEGWAVYGEQMMLENGFGDNAPEMWLMWYKWNLRSVCNTILDYGVHALNMSKEDAMNLLINEAFQQNAEAEGKWTRVSVTSVQLTSYFNGYKEITALRDAYKSMMGDQYKLKDFNEKFLGYGSAPVKYIKEMMLK